ncbi:hypothetical protein TCDM_11565 [Trypanosoma cruzi Dm28c]|uniref:Uncharacterized protein n=1 Tax=Trypanosoma cruzi Dm28c TaxID=1416333 RepID=V5B034_TRYCR|nr:hypothetical protein TCDM_11565 [Trypanosoma cruzi Dm28c]
MPCRNHSHRETRKSVWMCAESTATVIVRGGHRGTVRHAPAHTEQRPKPAVQKQRGVGRMTPRAGNTFTHGGHRAPALPFQHGTQANVPPSPKHSCRALCKYLFSVCWKSRRSTGRHINTARRTAGSQRYMRYDPNFNRHSRWQHTSIHKKKRKKTKNTAAGCGCVCGAAGVCPPWPQRKQNKRKEMCAPPHRPSSHAHTSRLPQRAVRRRPSSCVQQARRTGPSP